MKIITPAVLLAFLLFPCLLPAQKATALPKGKLFIIGGGDRPPSLIQSLVKTAELKEKDYVIVLPMSSASPDTSYTYFKADLTPACTNPIINYNFTSNKTSYTPWLDSLKKAKLIFITGGDQDRFMNAVLNTPVTEAIHTAYKNGATIAGTSAGAAVMSEHMITGAELTDTTYRATFRKIWDKNIEFKEGLGLLTTAIIDQHFIVRSRYNRLLSALAAFPSFDCIGIDEETAIIVQGNKITVTGESQVVVFRKPVSLRIASQKLIKVKDILFSIYTAGDEFLLTNQSAIK
jgi:cyanophycinase